MPHLEKSGWGKVWQVKHETCLAPLPHHLPPYRGGEGGVAGACGSQAVSQGGAKSHPLLTRAQAKVAGENRYFTGKPCPRGHVDQRKTSNAECCGCRAAGIGRGKVETRRQYRRNERLLKSGGATPEVKEALVASQGGACAICGDVTTLYVDHCHASGLIRAALCRSCNLALGMAKDDPSRLRKMAEYLETHRKV